jgi:hypothetical protein
MLLSDYIADVQEIVHDSSASCWPVSRVISRINDARRDAARDMWCVRQNVTGVQLLPGVEIYGLTGAIVGATIPQDGKSGGSNYGPGATVPIQFTPAPPGGVTATGIGNLTSGVVTSITMTKWGQGYTSVPTVAVGGIGSGAAPVAIPLFQANPLSTTIGNPLQVIGISFIWNGQRRTLNYLNFTLFQAYARMWSTATFTGPPGTWSHYQPGITPQIYIQTPPDQLYLAEFDCVFMPAPLVATTDADTQIIPPWTGAVQWKTASYLLNKHQNFGQAAQMDAKYDAFVPRVITTSGGIRIPNPYHKTFQRRVTGMGG